MATFTVQQVTRAGVVPTYNTAAAGGDAFANDGKVWVHVKNGAIALNITFETTITVDGLAVADLVVAVGATTEKVIGVFPTNWYNDGSNLVQMTYDDESNVTIAVMKY
jgi:hypothetical protein